MLLPHTCVIGIEMFLMVKQQDWCYWTPAEGSPVLPAISLIFIQEVACGIHPYCESGRSAAQKVSKGVWRSAQQLKIPAVAQYWWIRFFVPSPFPCSLQLRSYLHLKPMGWTLWEPRCGLRGHKLSSYRSCEQQTPQFWRPISAGASPLYVGPWETVF